MQKRTDRKREREREREEQGKNKNSGMRITRSRKDESACDGRLSARRRDCERQGEEKRERKRELEREMRCTKENQREGRYRLKE